MSDRPDMNHIVDIGINHGRTHCLCGIEITWSEPAPPGAPWCQQCLDLDG